MRSCIEKKQNMLDQKETHFCAMHACIECGLVLPLLTKAMSINDACANVYFGMGDNLNADGNLCACLLDNPDKIQCQTCSSCLSCAKQPIEY